MRYKKSIGLFLYTSFATMFLGICLLIPLLNNYILNEVIRQETNLDTRYYYRPMWSNNIFIKEEVKNKT